MPLFAFGAVAALAAVGGCERPASESVARNQASIIGGQLDTTHKGVVSLLKQVSGGFYPACSGTLLTPNLVLTAHHCVAALSTGDSASVVCATTRFMDVERPASMLISVEANVGTEGLDPFRVSQVWVPDGDNEVCGRDIALLLLAGAGVPASQATPIEPNLTGALAVNEVFAAVGYGLQDPKDDTAQTAGHRMSVNNAQVYCEGSACGTDLVLDGEFIADSPVCSGDSGGPALDHNGRVSGVTSRGDDKCTLGIYSGVSGWRDFIVAKTLVAASSGQYDPPAWAGVPPTGVDPGTANAGSSSGGSSSGGGKNSGSNAAGSAALAGGPSSSNPSGAGAGSVGASSPTVNPVGLKCDGQAQCPGSYVCWAVTSKPPGICVPQCSAQQATCPADFSCDTQLGACVRSADLPATQAKQNSCSVGAPGRSQSTSEGAWLALLLLGAAWRGRRGSR